MKVESILAIENAFEIEKTCIEAMNAFVSLEQYTKAVELLCNTPRIGTTGCGYSGIFVSTSPA